MVVVRQKNEKAHRSRDVEIMRLRGQGPGFGRRVVLFTSRQPQPSKQTGLYTMQRKSLFSMLITAALGLVIASPANADFATRTWKSTSSTDFSLAANWNPEDVPDTVHEEAIIPDVSGSLVIPVMTQAETVGGVEIQAQGTLKTGAYTLTIQASAGHGDGVMTIASGGTLHIQASGGVDLISSGVTHPVSGVIKIDANGTLGIGAGVTVELDSANTHPIGGDILLSSSTSVLRVSATTTLARNGANKGSVKGEHNDAQVLIDEPSSGTNTLTSNIIFEGNMTVARGVDAAGTATFKNGSTGIVRGNANGILLLAAGLALDDDCGAKWESIETNGNSTLEFGSTVVFVDSNPELRGDFVLSNCATMKFNGTTFKTAGSFSSPVGNILNSGGTFSYLNDGTCASPTDYNDVDDDQCFGGAPCCP